MGVCQVDALRPLKTKAASLGLLQKELASKDEFIASLQRQVSASARSSPTHATGGTSEQHAGSQRTSMEVITLQAEVRHQQYAVQMGDSLRIAMGGILFKSAHSCRYSSRNRTSAQLKLMFSLSSDVGDASC